MKNAEKSMSSMQSPITGEVDAVIVGAGFTGIYAVKKFRELGLSVQLFEKGADVGGTWYWNAYPGARCDVESMEYSYQFDEEIQQRWNWTERYPTQPEIRRYIEYAANKWGIYDHAKFETCVTSVVFDEDTGLWTIETDKGDRVIAKYCLLATGPLSQPIYPNIEGLDSFKGRMEHTGLWPQDGLDVTGLRVGIIGTGSSGAQCLSAISDVASEVHVFQRTPAYVVPAHNYKLDPEIQKSIKKHYKSLRDMAWSTRAGLRYGLGDRMALEFSEEERDRYYEESWRRGGVGFTATFFDLFETQEANNTCAEFVRKKIHEIVEDPDVAEKLCPYDTIGCRRLLVVDGFYEAFNKPNVSLVDVKETPIERIVPEGVVVDGKTYELDVIILATGFDALTGAINQIDIQGRGDLRLKDRLMTDPKALAGMAFSDFPNLFTVHGPGSIAALGNMVPMGEFSVNWITDAIDYMRRNGKALMEPDHEAEDAWAKRVDDRANESLYVTCRSYYLGDNVPGKPRKFLLYLGGVPDYVSKCNEIAENGYEGFHLV
jgi:cyclohexanone monooxygenase